MSRKANQTVQIMTMSQITHLNRWCLNKSTMGLIQSHYCKMGQIYTVQHFVNTQVYGCLTLLFPKKSPTVPIGWVLQVACKMRRRGKAEQTSQTQLGLQEVAPSGWARLWSCVMTYLSSNRHAFFPKNHLRSPLVGYFLVSKLYLCS